MSYQFTEPGLYHYVYNMADLSELRGCVVVQPRPREHVIEIADGQCTPGKELYNHVVIKLLCTPNRLTYIEVCAMSWTCAHFMFGYLLSLGDHCFNNVHLKLGNWKTL